MRILLIIDGLPGGGAEKVVLTLAQAFVEKGDEVTLFSLRDVCDYPLPGGVQYRLIADHSRTPWRRLTELSRRARALDSAVREAERHGAFDLVLSHLHKTDRIVAHSRILSRRNLWFCLHGLFSRYLQNKRGAGYWLKRWKIRQLYHGRNLVTVSDAVAQDLRQRFALTPARVVTIYNPFQFEAIRQRATAPCDMAGQDYILHVGRFHPVKRHDRLLEAYAQSGLRVPLVLIGAGSERQEAQLRAQAARLGIADKLIFKGFQANPMPWIYHARLLVLCSDNEGFGNVLIEALLLNTPVVSTRCGGTQEILTDDLARGLADLNSQSLADVMRQVYHQPPVIDTNHLRRFASDQVCERYRRLANPGPDKP